MGKVLHILLVSLFSSTIIPCGDEKEEHSRSEYSTNTTTTTRDDSETKTGNQKNV